MKIFLNRHKRKMLDEIADCLNDMQNEFIDSQPKDILLNQSVRIISRIETLLCAYQNVLEGKEWKEEHLKMYLGQSDEKI